MRATFIPSHFKFILYKYRFFVPRLILIVKENIKIFCFSFFAYFSFFFFHFLRAFKTFFYVKIDVDQEKRETKI